jgi:hypothetical protein
VLVMIEVESSVPGSINAFSVAVCTSESIVIDI